MTFRFPYIPRGMQRLLSKYFLCSFPHAGRTLYITFDDGPDPETTPVLLEILRRYNAAATFFCVGENVKRYPDLFQQLLKEKHGVGNHTMHHLHGWKTPCKKYVDDIQEARCHINSPLFRPPHGKITWKQWKHVRRDFRVVLWTVISYDFDAKLTSEQCFQYVVRYAKGGDVLVFHDSRKSFERTCAALVKVLDYFHRRGFCFKALQ